MGLATPREIIIVAIEAANVLDFSEECSADVAAAAPAAAQVVLDIITMWYNAQGTLKEERP